MDRDVLPRVTYWTGVWHPSREALSKEVDLLRRQGGRVAPVVSFATRQKPEWCRKERVIKLAGHQQARLHLLAAALERFGDVTHAFGALSEWHLLRFLGRRPLVYTAALRGPTLDRWLYDKVAVFAAESQPLADILVAAGVSAQKIEIVYPGVDLDAYAPAPLPDGRFRILFASTPADVAEFDVRGILLMIEAARLLPDVDFVLLWRRWGDVAAATRALAALDPPPNVLVDLRDAADMVSEYQRAHATICAYAQGFGKSSPNSVIEGLACGRPTLVSPAVGTSALIEENGAGIVIRRDPEGLVAAITELRQDVEGFSRRARRLAESHFGVERFTARYAELYHRVLGHSPSPVLAGSPASLAELPGRD